MVVRRYPARSLGMALVLVAVIVGTAAFAQGDDEGGVVAATLAWKERFDAGVAADVAALYARSFTFRVVAGQRFDSHEATAAYVQGIFDLGYDRVDLEVADALVVGEMATTTGSFVFRGPEVLDFPGDFIAVFVWEDGGWRLARHVTYQVPAPPS